MAKPKNHGKEYTKADDKKIEKLASQGVSTKKIAEELGRTEEAIRTHANEADISLKPTDPKNK